MGRVGLGRVKERKREGSMVSKVEMSRAMKRRRRLLDWFGLVRAMKVIYTLTLKK